MDLVGNEIGIDSSSFISSNGGATGSGVVGSSGGGLGEASNGPILYNEPNRTSAIDDIRSVVIYIFIVTILFSFFLILPGIRNDKFPTFLCITTSLIVFSIISISLLGTTWHVGEAPISAAYKAFSRDRIQGDLSVRIGLQSVNITLSAQKYFILHETRGPMIMFNSPAAPILMDHNDLNNNQQSKQQTQQQSQLLKPEEQTGTNGLEVTSADASTFFNSDKPQDSRAKNLADELLSDKTSDGSPVDTELEVDEVFSSAGSSSLEGSSESSMARRSRASSNSSTIESKQDKPTTSSNRSKTIKRDTLSSTGASMSLGGQKYTVKRVDVDINYNERFYWIEPNQMHHEHQRALERGLPYPILTVVEYLSQDEAGFSWSRQYRSAGYYSYIILCLALCVWFLMFLLHCTAPKYGIYTMQLLGGILLFATLTYATLVPRGEQKLVIPFEGQSLTFRFGWNFWLVLIGGCLSLSVGTIMLIVDYMFPNFILTTVLDVDYDHKHKHHKQKSNTHQMKANVQLVERPIRPPFFQNNSTSSSSSSTDLSSASRSSIISLEFNRNKIRATNLESASGKTTTTTDADVLEYGSKVRDHSISDTTTLSRTTTRNRLNKLAASSTTTTSSSSIKKHISSPSTNREVVFNADAPDTKLKDVSLEKQQISNGSIQKHHTNLHTRYVEMLKDDDNDADKSEDQNVSETRVGQQQSNNKARGTSHQQVANVRQLVKDGVSKNGHQSANRSSHKNSNLKSTDQQSPSVMRHQLSNRQPMIESQRYIDHQVRL